jgi:hypothetical protein
VCRRQNRARVDQRATAETGTGKEKDSRAGKLVGTGNCCGEASLIIDGDRAGGLSGRKRNRSGPPK